MNQFLVQFILRRIYRKGRYSKKKPHVHCNFHNTKLTIHRKIKRNMGVCTESKFSKRRSPLLSLMVPHFDVKLQLSVTRISIICNLRNCQRYRGRSKPTSRVVRGGEGAHLRDLLDIIDQRVACKMYTGLSQLETNLHFYLSHML